VRTVEEIMREEWRLSLRAPELEKQIAEADKKIAMIEAIFWSVVTAYLVMLTCWTDDGALYLVAIAAYCWRLMKKRLRLLET